MTAFLIAFVLALRCRVLNRPSANGLSGPAWRPEQWIRAAAKAGIPVQPRQRSIAPHRPAEPEVSGDIELTVIGGHVFLAAEAPLAERALSLANITGAGLLGLGFNRRGSGFELAVLTNGPT